ncbi:hypothetical protein JXJ21_23720 [candidate division KSB1 bacterium]|nr:hypothetical protein [candidate division KSB1 bacterium]
MTPKERWLAAIHAQPIDRLPFWPKLNASYPIAQSVPFLRMTLDALHQWIGSDMHQWLPACLREKRSKTSFEISTSGKIQTTTFRTRNAQTQLIKKFDETSQSWHPIVFPIKRLEEIELMTDFFSDASIALNDEALALAKEQVSRIGDDALTASAIGKSALMDFVEMLAGVETAHYLLADHPAAVEALFAAIHKVLLEKTRILAENSPADVLYMVENTSTTLISPEQYLRYCYEPIHQYAACTHAAGKPMILHTCGHLKALLPVFNGLPARAFEAFTSPPLGNTTLLDGRTACPQKCLIGGTNAILWTRSAAEIIAQIKRDLDELPHHRGVVLTSAGVMPPLCKPETIKKVADWVKAYPVR